MYNIFKRVISLWTERDGESTKCKDTIYLQIITSRKQTEEKKKPTTTKLQLQGTFIL